MKYFDNPDLSQVRDEIEQLMDDDGDMAEMYLTEKKEKMENYFYKDQNATLYAGGSVSAPVSPVCSPPESRKLEKNLSIAVSRHSSSRVSEEDSDIQELEMLLEAYFVVIDAILNKLTSVCLCFHIDLSLHCMLMHIVIVIFHLFAVERIY